MPTKKKKADPANGISLEKAKQKKKQKDAAGFPIVGMGASAGGLETFNYLFLRNKSFWNQP